MKFDAVTIKNFRNFENITIDLTNKNVLFGMNDVGKTNFLNFRNNYRCSMALQCDCQVFHSSKVFSL